MSSFLFKSKHIEENQFGKMEIDVDFDNIEDNQNKKKIEKLTKKILNNVLRD